MTAARPKLTYFCGERIRTELARRGWSAARLAYEVYKRMGVETTPSTLAGVFKAGAELDEEGKPRLHNQPNATLALAVMAALELTPENVTSRI